MCLDRPVVDKTEISGRYDFRLNWTPDERQYEGRAFGFLLPAGDSSPLPDLFSAIQKELGLKLESAKLPVEVLVLDHVEKPSAN